jgi:NAD(P)-dependent dehydrogenase (short-subunit alcohol dehydrogenase family)
VGLIRTLVVGASSGIGRAIAEQSVPLGPVVAAARRTPEVEGAHGIHVDVTDPHACAALVTSATEEMGGLDRVVLAAGWGRLARLDSTEDEVWQRTFATNVVGLAQVAAACLPHLRGHGQVGLLSSDSVTRPMPGLGAYTASKAALEKLVDVWRLEEPEVAFTRVVVGATLTDFAQHFDRELLVELFPTWQRLGHALVAPMNPDHVARVVLQAMADRTPELVVQPC